MLKGVIYISLFFSVLTFLLVSSDSNAEITNVPTNRNSSVQYLLYTPENPTKPCYIESEPSAFDSCFFDSSLKTKFLIHGYLIKLLPGNLFVKIKDTLLKYEKYNVIIVNWTKYNQEEYPKAMRNAYLVGGDLAAMINFIMYYKGVSATSVHLIGHSLGAHIAGVAGKGVFNLGRITGLDPAGPGYTEVIKLDRLDSTDAEIVDAIHSSNAETGYGFGTHYPMAGINYYPNGGESQPMCKFGKIYSDGDGVLHKILMPSDQSGCFHDSAIQYFISSIFDCKYNSTQCDHYISYERGLCKPPLNQTDLMGFHSVESPALQDHSKFYLHTSGTAPFC